MIWQAVTVGLIAVAAVIGLVQAWRVGERLTARERELAQLGELVRRLEGERSTAPAVAAAPPAEAAAPDLVARALEQVADARSTFATLVATRVVPQRRHRAGEPFVLVVEVALLNGSAHDVRLSLRTRENETPLVVRRYLGQPQKLYSAPQPIPADQTGESERGGRAQVVPAGGIETVDFAVPLHEAGLYRLAFRVRGDTLVPEDAKGGGAVVWQRQVHVVVA